jgi:exopolysaccharide biosynthesis protein
MFEHFQKFRQRLQSHRLPFLLLCFCLSGCAAMHEDEIHSSIPIQYMHIAGRDPNFSIHAVRVNLKDPRVSVHVARGGVDPDGDGPWLTTLLPTSEIAEREHFAVAINGDFFEAEATKDIEGKNTGYVRGKAAAPEGMAMSNGVLWHQPRTRRPYLEITDANVARIETGADPVDAAAREIVGGSNIIVQGGHGILFTNAFATTRHPRTAVGIDATGTWLTLVVVDGRQPELSVGMTLDELADEMLKLGCTDAINLDGGGSSTLVYRDEISQELRVLNSPSDTKERSVADVLGVSLK